jgi:Zn-dependent peptidase ImmA (M78 family)
VNKSALKRLALEVRAELDLTAEERFDPYALADLYGVPVIQVSDTDCSPEAREHFQRNRSDVFSGALIPLSDGTTAIVENDSHSPQRRRSTVSHEMAHLILEHSFDTRLVNERGCRLMDSEQEAEAQELGAELLVPASAALFHARRRSTDATVADAVDVSVEAARWRMNHTGARKIAARAHAKYQRMRTGAP